MKLGCKKLTEKDYDAILYEFNATKSTQDQIAKRLGLSRGPICQIAVCKKAIESGDSSALFTKNQAHMIPDRMYAWALGKMGAVKESKEKKQAEIPPIMELGPQAPNPECIHSESDLRGAVEMGIQRKVHVSPIKCIEYIDDILRSAKNAGISYDISDMRSRVVILAAQAGSDAAYCQNLVEMMPFKTADRQIEDQAPIIREIVEERNIPKDETVKPIAFFDKLEALFNDELHKTIDDGDYQRAQTLLDCLEYCLPLK